MLAIFSPFPPSLSGEQFLGSRHHTQTAHKETVEKNRFFQTIHHNTNGVDKEEIGLGTKENER